MIGRVSEGFSQTDTICLPAKTVTEIAADLALLDGYRAELVILEKTISDYSFKTARLQLQGTHKDTIIDRQTAELVNSYMENSFLTEQNGKLKTQRNVLGGSLGIVLLILILL